jgi:hypothetical protein
LCDGRVLVAGSGPDTTAEVYRPDLPRPTSGNLLVNGNAEASGALPLGWVATPNFSVLRYDPGTSTGFPTSTESARIGGGKRFFTGGPATASSRACQAVDLSRSALRVDAGRATVTLSARLGGYLTQADSASVSARFRSATGAQLGVVGLDPVDAGDRQNQTRLEPRARTVKVPPKTRSVEVVIVALRPGAGPTEHNDGYVDNVALNLTTTPLPLATITGFEIAPYRFRAGKSGGTTVSYNRTGRGATTFTVLRRKPGRRVDGKCRKPTKSNRDRPKCRRYTRVGSFVRLDKVGVNSFRYLGRVAGVKLKSGRYRLRAVPQNAEGAAGAAVKRGFRIVD